MRPASAVPSLLPFMVAGVGVLMALNVVHLLWEWWGSPTVPNVPRAHRQAPAQVQPRRVDVPTFGHNLQFGNPGAGAVLTVFTDPACAPCRQQLGDVLQSAGKGIRVVYKFWPQNQQQMAGGLVTEIARREGVATAFMRALENQPAASGDDLLAVLEGAGVPLAKQQNWLKGKLTDLLDNLNLDITQGQQLQLGPPPQFVLNGYLLEPGTLPIERLPQYVQRLNAGQPLIQPNDYWLNP